MFETKEFQKWLKIEVARFCGTLTEAEREVERQMNSKNLRIEVKHNGMWVRAPHLEIS
jgi:hypothetical protein